MSSKLTPKQRQFLKAYKAKNGNITNACRASKTHRSTVYAWLKSDESDVFRRNKNEIDSDFLDLAESKLIRLIKKNNFLAIKFLLETKGRARGYGKHEEINVNTTNGLTPEESAQMLDNHRSQKTLEVAEHKYVATLSESDQKGYWADKIAAIDDADAFAINRIERQIHKQMFFNTKYAHLKKTERVDRFKANVDDHNRDDS